MSSPDWNEYDLDQYDHGGDPREYQQDENDSAEDSYDASSEDTEHDDNSDDPYYFLGEY